MVGSINSQLAPLGIQLSLWTELETGIELDCPLKMFLSEFVHPEVLQSQADHPVIKRIVGGEFVGLFFMSDCFFGFPQRCRCACKLIICQNKTAITLDGIAPNGHRFVLAAHLPDRFAFLLPSDN